MVTAARREADGLTPAEVQERVARGAVNTQPDGPSRTTREIIRANVVTRFNILLGTLLVITLVVVGEPRDALFGIVLVANAAIGIVQELRAKATLDRLALLTAPRAKVVRNGSTMEVPVDRVVVDDVMVLRPGDQLVVDGTVMAARNLEINEALLTGESEPVQKNPDDSVLSGSFVAAGSGLYRATRVGTDAYAAKLAKEAKRFTLVKSELRDGIDWVLGAIGWTVGPVMALLVWSQLRVHDGFREAVRAAVAGAVGMVPQGLVLLTSIAFAVGVIRLGRRQVLVQELPAIEGLARVDTVCFDKTGTLTEGQLVVKDVVALGELDPSLPLGALGATDPDPNATLAAIVEAFPPSPEWRATESVPFSSSRKWSGASFDGLGTWTLGAPEVLSTRADVLDSAERHAAAGNRVLLLAATHDALDGDRLPKNLEEAALVVLGDRVRADATATLGYFGEQGVHAKVISGDHPHTVATIAAEVGVPGAERPFDARQLPTDADELAEVMERHSVFGRVTPYQKRAMVGALQSRGHVVAMTGDGVNDVLALKDADIGIAMGSGSAAARAVAQLVLINGNFDTLPSVVGEGRRVISNIERVANLFVTKAVYALFLAVAVGLASRPFPFLPRHLTLVGSVTIGIPAFFLALAPSGRRARTGFVMRVLRFAIPTGLAAGLATLAAYELSIAEDATLDEARTMATFVLAAIGLFALGMVSRPLVAWKRALIGTMAAVLAILVWAPASQEFFALDLPRVAVVLAAVGVVAITGTVMVGSLQAVGWIRHVEEVLRAGPPEPSEALESLRQRWRSFRATWGEAEAPPDAWPRPAPEAVDDAGPPVDLRAALAESTVEEPIEDLEPLLFPDHEQPGEWVDIDELLADHRELEEG